MGTNSHRNTSRSQLSCSTTCAILITFIKNFPCAKCEKFNLSPLERLTRFPPANFIFSAWDLPGMIRRCPVKLFFPDSLHTLCSQVLKLWVILTDHIKRLWNIMRKMLLAFELSLAVRSFVHSPGNEDEIITSTDEAFRDARYFIFHFENSFSSFHLETKTAVSWEICFQIIK